ncbi:unnamed protein product, partial [Strongylus vulgaris]
MRGYLQFIILLFVLYFWACVPFVYTVSFMFSSPSKANVLLIIWQLVAAFAAMIVLFLLSLQETVDPSLLEIIGVANDEEDSAVREERIYVTESGEDLALEVQDLCKMYGRLRAVDGLTMGVRSRECFGLLGVNGAGKTTTFDILTGQLFATA